MGPFLASIDHKEFERRHMEAVYDFSRGNLRAIDHLCRTALELAAQQKLETIDSGLVTVARKKLP